MSIENSSTVEAFKSLSFSKKQRVVLENMLKITNFCKRFKIFQLLTTNISKQNIMLLPPKKISFLVNYKFIQKYQKTKFDKPIININTFLKSFFGEKYFFQERELLVAL